jgi:hypothetical protein
VTSVVLSVAIAAVAAILGLRQASERRTREPSTSEADRNHFSRQDLRRGLGVAALLLLALGILVGSRLEPRVRIDRHEARIEGDQPAPADEPAKRPPASRANLRFVGLWVGVIALIPILLTLALLDLLATRRYAERHRRTLARERIELLRELRHAEDPGDEDLHRPGPNHD